MECSMINEAKILPCLDGFELVLRWSRLRRYERYSARQQNQSSSHVLLESKLYLIELSDDNKLSQAKATLIYTCRWREPFTVAMRSTKDKKLQDGLDRWRGTLGTERICIG